MAVVPAPAKVLVTGASGFIGIHVVKALIDKGYNVRGTVRSAKKGDYIKNLFGSKFEYVIVVDMEAPNAYDEAVKGVDAVEHTASVVKMVAGDPDEVIKPAIAGTVGILESVKKFGPTVRRVVITSSRAAIGGPDESHWNQRAVDAVQKDGADALPHSKYAASKVLAERAAWEFVEKNKAEIDFDITTLCPSWVWGPLLHETSGPESFNESINFLINGIDNPKTGTALVDQTANAVDVRDVAVIHAEVLSLERASHERFLTSSDGWSWQDVYDALNADPAFERMPVGQPGAANRAAYAVPSSAKLVKVLGRSHSEVFRPVSVTVRDTIASAMERGWVPNGSSV